MMGGGFSSIAQLCYTIVFIEPMFFDDSELLIASLLG